MAFARFDIKALAGGCQVFVYAILYAPRHDVLNTASLGAYFSLIIACFSVLKHDVLNAASLGEVCCHVALLNQE